jgi:hypothetical protein
MSARDVLGPAGPVRGDSGALSTGEAFCQRYRAVLLRRTAYASKINRLPVAADDMKDSDVQETSRRSSLGLG